ncbi:MAG TPA: hypothetical protein VF693_07810 [Allosphingosinicella sp.]
MASLWFAWRGEPRRFGAAYMSGWGLIIVAMMWLLSGEHGSHGDESYMLAWGLAYLLPIVAMVSIGAAFLAGGAFYLGSKLREG